MSKCKRRYCTVRITLGFDDEPSGVAGIVQASDSDDGEKNDVVLTGEVIWRAIDMWMPRNGLEIAKEILEWAKTEADDKDTT